MKVENVSIISEAVVNLNSISPNILMNLVLGGMFGLPAAPNAHVMTIFLTDKNGSIGDYIKATKMENLFVMTSGPHPSELLSSKRMIRLEHALEGMFEIVIYDTPPLLSFADAQ